MVTLFIIVTALGLQRRQPPRVGRRTQQACGENSFSSRRNSHLQPECRYSCGIRNLGYAPSRPVISSLQGTGMVTLFIISSSWSTSDGKKAETVLKRCSAVCCRTCDDDEERACCVRRPTLGGCRRCNPSADIPAAFATLGTHQAPRVGRRTQQACGENSFSSRRNSHLCRLNVTYTRHVDLWRSGGVYAISAGPAQDLLQRFRKDEEQGPFERVPKVANAAGISALGLQRRQPPRVGRRTQQACGGRAGPV
jgi:hypothetical protein